MSSLLGSLNSAADSLNVFEQAISTIQSNVTNATVDNYTEQSPELGTSVIGVTYLGNSDARNGFAESAVWDSSQSLGYASAQADNLSTIQSQFDVSGSAGVPGALSTLYSAFSAWSQSPTDTTARNQVLVAANQVARAFNQTSQSLQQSQAQVDTELGNTVAKINSIEQNIAGLNEHIQNNGGSDPTTQAQLYQNLQQLSQLTDISVHVEANGTATVLMNGRVPLVVGTTASAVVVAYPSDSSSPNPTAPAHALIRVNGQDITVIASGGGESAGGQLAGLLNVRNNTLPALVGDQQQQGSLNQLAQGFADRINAVLTSGTTDGTTAGQPLFNYVAGKATSVASSLSVNSAVGPSDLAAIDSSSVANGIPTTLAGLSNSSDPANQINGSNFTDFYSKAVADLGSQSASAQQSKTAQTDQLTQAENLRSQSSGISLNEQASLLLQYQQAYQASTQLVSVLNTMTGYLMDMINTN